MAITDIDISETLEAGAPSIKYTGNRDPNSIPPWERDNPFGEEPKDQVIDEEATIRVASDPSWESEWEDAYQNYKIKQINNNQEFVDKETFMDQYQNNMASGGRVNFGLGSIFKSIKKGVKKAVKSPLGKAALLYAGTAGLGNLFAPGGGTGWGNMFGKAGWMRPSSMAANFLGKAATPGKWSAWGAPGVGSYSGSPATGGILSKLGLTKGAGSMMPTALGWGTAALGAGMGAQAFENMQPDDIEALKNNPEALRAYLTEYHTNTNPDKTKEEVDLWVEQNMYSTGGRVGFDSGSDNKPNGWFKTKIKEKIKPYTKEGRGDYKKEWLHSKGLDMTVEEWDDKPLKEKLKIWFREGNAQGGRTGFAFGPDQTAQAAGIMGQLPVRDNAAGVKELDLRDSGGFIPPVGVKEKADDIPAMLSNNEFVMTADAVRAAGGGSVEKGAQVMYDQMKNLENRIA